MWDGETSRFGAKCVVADASLLDENVCYDLQHKCFYNYQCCTGRCSDDDGDAVYTCSEHTTPATTPTRFAVEPVGSKCYGKEKSACKTTQSCMWRAASCYSKTTSTTSTTTTVRPTKPPLGNEYGGGYGGADGGYGADGTSFVADGEEEYSRVQNGVPAGAAIVLGLICLIGLVVGVAQLAKRGKSAWLTNEYKKLGVDKIPNKRFMTAEEDGAYWRQANLIDAENDIQDIAQDSTVAATNTSKRTPQLPPRDYTLTGRGTASAGDSPASDYGDSDGEDSWSEDSGSDVPQLPPTEF